MKHYPLSIIFALLVLGYIPLKSEEVSSLKTIKPRLVQPLEFDGLKVSSFDQVSDINSLFNKKISMGGQDGYEFLRLDLDDDKSYVRVETAGQYLEMRRKGAGPYTTYDITMDGWFEKIVPALVLPSIVVLQSTVFWGKTLRICLFRFYLGWEAKRESGWSLTRKKVSR